MKIIVVGGTGLIGSRLAAHLRQHGHAVTVATRATGVDTVSGTGLADVLAGAETVVDVVNSPFRTDDEAMVFFTASAANLLAAARAAGVRHHLALSVVGANRLPDSGYFRAKAAQEALIQAAGLPYTIVRSTQFFELLDRIANAAMRQGVVRLSPAYVQPLAAADAAALIAGIAAGVPANRTVELAGPERFSLDDLVRRYLQAKNDDRRVIADVRARYFGAVLDDTSLTPGKNPHVGATSFDMWLRRSTAH